jgi:hypothetical protein
MGLQLFRLPNHGGLIVAAVIVLVVFAVRLAPLLFSRNKPNAHLPLGAPRDYGLAGGAVCPRCHRPSPLGLLTLNLGFGTKLTRCAFCGKWSVVRRLGLAELRAAEAAEVAEAQPSQPIAQKSEADKTKDAMDDSRFIDQR